MRFWVYFLLFCVFLFLAYAYPVKAKDDRDVNYWFAQYVNYESLYRDEWDSNQSPCVLWPLQDAGVLTWRDSSQALPSYLDMYRWSGNKLYLDRFVERANQIVGYASDTDGDGFLGWKSTRLGTDQKGEFFVYDLAITGVLGSFVNLIEEEKIPGYAEAINNYREIAYQMGQKWSFLWVNLEDGRGLYQQIYNGTIPARSFPINMQAIAGLYHYEMGDTLKTEALARTIESTLKTTYSYPVWDYASNILITDRIVTPRVDDYNHAAMTIRFLLRVRPNLTPGLLQTSLSAWDGSRFFWRIDGTEDLPTDVSPHTFYFPFYRHMEIGPELYDAVSAQWSYMQEREIECKAGSYLSILSLILLKKFPQEKTYLPLIDK